ncbi:DEAD/DEAH box helicase [Gordonia sp. (in: high G+C Gram-positive bacteria)]|jgi:DEAD/DEAH box helicase domain-containing protein|uniref:DEAD/DEAH box helicase n=1 Tax=Gordonia sp. (in: high G+C Gram-positive bacteria) TaxID=84139 RepID=UPI001D700C96|nr:DEAD/DEAH box helicase [Gordonia sp. (in: high G+C Gram-positive bacteria)]MCB1295723.1 DEAD/DEAH box helicase [Gordonia sp. (in: high G+C Gram-positive bacteria)]
MQITQQSGGSRGPSYGEQLLSHVLSGSGIAVDSHVTGSGHTTDDVGTKDPTLTHLSVIDSTTANFADWPGWVPKALVQALAQQGISRPWVHQARAASLAHDGSHVVVSTPTASGKSLAYQLPILTALLTEPRATALYIAPTKALGADQIRAVATLTATRPEFSHLQPCAYDGDTEPDIRQWARAHSRWIFTNPDMLHLGILSTQTRWRHFLRNLRYVVIDECHHYRGVFGSHTGLVLRRLLRVARAAGADPVVIASSATVARPAESLTRLLGEPAVAVTDDGSPHGERTVALWQPGFIPGVTGENDAPVRRAAGAESARLLADFVIEGARTLCFTRSRVGAELTARQARQILAEAAPELVGKVAAYRAGYLADDRRALERAINDAELTGVATTNALELGVDISGLDAVIVAGYPGSVASFWQQAGRAGRQHHSGDSLVVLVARDDPLDTYLVHHPEALLDKPVEATVTDPGNPYILGPHLLCAAAELPLTESDVDEWDARAVVDELTAQGALKRRRAGWYVGAGIDPHAQVNLRGGSGTEVLIVDTSTGRLLGTVDAVRAMSTVYAGAVHIHQGETFVVDELDLDDGLALTHPEEPDWTTSARETTGISVGRVIAENRYGPLTVAFAEVEVTGKVIGYLRTLLTGEVLDSVPLDMPEQTLPTRAVLYTLTPEALADAGVDAAAVPGALHAAEHAAIGLLPLVATCDRGDIGGVSTLAHPDTGLPTVFVYDGHLGGAGFAERGHEAFAAWIGATREAVSACRCASGCPSCVQSPKCGNGNEPLDKAGAIAVLTLIESLIGTG